MVLIVPNTMLVAIKGQSGGQDVVNVVGIRNLSANAAVVAGAVQTAWKVTGGPMSRMPSTYSLLEFKALSLGSLDGEVYTLPDSAAGTRSGSLATNGSCALVTYGNGTRSKSNKGRMYFGPLLESDVNADGRTLGTPSAYTTAMTNFKNSITASLGEWVIVSRKNATTALITTITTQTVIATQRRRIR